MADVFISYSSKDKTKAQNLTAVLKEKEIDYWIDFEHLPKGAKYDDYITEAIAECGTVVVLLSRNSLESENVKNEVRIAKFFSKGIIPFMLEDVPLKEAFLYHIESNSRIFADSDWENAIMELVEALGRIDPSREDTRTIDSILDDANNADPIPERYGLVNKPQSQYTGRPLAEMAAIARQDVVFDSSLFQTILEAEQGKARAQRRLAKAYLKDHFLISSSPKEKTDTVIPPKDQTDECLAEIECTTDPVSVDKAIYWLNHAIDQNDLQAMFFLASCYEDGMGVPQNNALAAFWYEQCASQPNPSPKAVFEMARCCAEGIGIGNDPLVKAKWYRLAMQYENALDVKNPVYTSQYLKLFTNRLSSRNQKLIKAGYSRQDAEKHMAERARIYRFMQDMRAFSPIGLGALLAAVFVILAEIDATNDVATAFIIYSPIYLIPALSVAAFPVVGVNYVLDRNWDFKSIAMLIIIWLLIVVFFIIFTTAADQVLHGMRKMVEQYLPSASEIWGWFQK